MARETTFVVIRHFRGLTAYFRGPGLRVLVPEPPFWFIFGGDLIFIARKLVGG